VSTPESTPARTGVVTDGRKVIVRLSVPIDRHTHARLCAVSALSGKDRSVIAAEILRKELIEVKASVPGKVAAKLGIDPEDTTG
jgi:hypothetical protein